jgi:hypothetical protein
MRPPPLRVNILQYTPHTHKRRKQKTPFCSTLCSPNSLCNAALTFLNERKTEATLFCCSSDDKKSFVFESVGKRLATFQSCLADSITTVWWNWQSFANVITLR